jgi:hypothetical protein
MTTEKTTFKTPLSYENQTIAYFRGCMGQQKRLLKTIQAVLPPHLVEHIHCCLLKGNKLLVYTDSAVWASQLRFYNAALVSIEPSVLTVQIKVITEQVGLVAKTERKAQLPSAKKIAEMRKDSLSIEDQPLQAALLKLSATLARRLANQLANKE